jgi:hypothetical protein
MNDDQLDARLHAALDDLATEVPEDAPPAFSWQQPAPVAGRRTRSARIARVAAPLTAAAAVAAVVATLMAGAGPDAATPTPLAAPSTSPASTAPSPPPYVPPSSSDVPSLLLAAADTAVATGKPVLRPDQYYYFRSTGAAPSTSYGNGPLIPPPAGAYSLREIWVPADPQDPDRAWLRRDSVIGMDQPTSGEEGAIDNSPDEWSGVCGDFYKATIDGKVGRTPDDDPCARAAGFDDPSPRFIAGLTRDPDQLLAELQAWAAGSVNPQKVHDVSEIMLMEVDSLLAYPSTSPDLVAALYNVVGRIPGVQVVPGVETTAGTGTGFRYDAVDGEEPHTSTSMRMLVLDLQTGAYLGSATQYGGQPALSGVLDLGTQTVGVADQVGVPGR